MLAGVCKLELLLPENHSLKGKRQVLRKIKGKAFHRFQILVVEVDHQNLWQRSQLGFSVVGTEEGKVTSLIDGIVQFVEALGEATVLRKEVQIVEV